MRLAVKGDKLQELSFRHGAPNGIVTQVHVAFDEDKGTPAVIIEQSGEQTVRMGFETEQEAVKEFYGFTSHVSRCALKSASVKRHLAPPELKLIKG